MSMMIKIVEAVKNHTGWPMTLEENEIVEGVNIPSFEWNGRRARFVMWLPKNAHGSLTRTLHVSFVIYQEPNDNINALKEADFYVQDDDIFAVNPGLGSTEVLVNDRDNIEMTIKETIRVLDFQINKMEEAIRIAESGLPENVIQGPWGGSTASLFTTRRAVRAGRLNKLAKGSYIDWVRDGWAKKLIETVERQAPELDWKINVFEHNSKVVKVFLRGRGKLNGSPTGSVDFSCEYELKAPNMWQKFLYEGGRGGSGVNGKASRHMWAAWNPVSPEKYEMVKNEIAESFPQATDVKFGAEAQSIWINEKYTTPIKGYSESTVIEMVLVALKRVHGMLQDNVVQFPGS